MDITQDSTGTSEKKEAPEQPKPEIKLPIDISNLRMPSFKLPEGGILQLLKIKFAEYKRVWQITKKPDKTEYTAAVKASGLGIIVIGVIGFIIAMIVQILQRFG